MTAKPYAPQSWSDNEALFEEKMNAMTNNDQWLFENMPTVYYNGFGLNKTTGTKIMVGTVIIGKNAASGEGGNTFYFGNFFSAGSHPIVITSINSHPQRRFHHATRGIGTFWPDHRGFEIRISADELNVANNRINAHVYATFIAVGW